MNKGKLIESIKQHKKNIAVVLIALLLIGGGSIYALSNDGNSTTPKSAKQSEIRKDEDKSSDDKTSDDTKSDEKSNNDSTSSDNEDTKKDTSTSANNSRTSDNTDKLSSDGSNDKLAEKPANKPTDKPSSGAGTSKPSEPSKPTHTHNWIEVSEDRTYAFINSGFGACNKCGKIVQNGLTGVDSVKEHSQESGHGSWHEDWYHEGYCYECGGHFAFRQCAMGNPAREHCKNSETFVYSYEESENAFMYYETCSCGANSMVSDGSMGLIKNTIIKCSDCGEVK